MADKDRDKKGRNQEFSTEATAEEKGAINPSAPSAGTEGWGQMNRTEAEVVGGSNPTESRPGTEGAGDVRKTSYPRNEAAENDAARRRDDDAA